MKRWLRLRGLHDTFRGGVGSFLLQLLVVSNLQHPPAAAAARPANDTRAVRGNLGVLLLHFFEVFGLHFNYRKVGISLTDGGSFYVKERRGWGRDDEPGSLSVENPLDPSQDVGEKAFRIAFFRRACQHAPEDSVEQPQPPRRRRTPGRQRAGGFGGFGWQARGGAAAAEAARRCPRGRAGGDGRAVRAARGGSCRRSRAGWRRR